jgi:hypothetical protein
MRGAQRQRDIFRVTVASYHQDAVFDAVVQRVEESPRRPDVAQADDGRFRAVVYLRAPALERLRTEELLVIVSAENISARRRVPRLRRLLH